MRFTKEELAAFAGHRVPDLIGPDCRLLFVGTNPGLWSAATRSHFARRGNRFYPALLRAGIIDADVDASSGMSDADRDRLLARGLGLTNIVSRASVGAADLTAAELRAGATVLREKVRRIQPAVVAVLGITAYRTAFGERTAKPGRQGEDWGDSQVWVLPNPSGLNAHETVDTLAVAYRAAARAAGIDVGA
ncbi:MAG: mismatch-specific DNA-glycosylase [Gordonia sp. (in: high G+C Gram-positive bacteria)]